jgi:broad specificity phosphatase PhoE
VADKVRKPIKIDHDLIECDFGSFEGRVIRDVMREHNVVDKEALPRILPADGEQWPSVLANAPECDPAIRLP